MRKYLIIMFMLLFSIPLMAEDLNIAVVDIESLAAFYPGAEEKTEELNTAIAEVQAEIDEMEEEIAELSDGLDLLTPAKKATREELIDEKLTALADYTTAKQEELTALNVALAEEMMEEIQVIIEEYATESGYDLVIQKSSTFYYIDSIDITQSIIDTKF